jgi:hypothetical protein
MCLKIESWCMRNHDIILDLNILGLNVLNEIYCFIFQV